MKKTLFTNATIIDCTGAEPIPRGQMLIEDDRIAAVGRTVAEALCEHAETVDVSGTYIMPGLMNCHVHVLCDRKSKQGIAAMATAHPTRTTLKALENMRTLLDGGVTYFRDVGGTHEIDIELRNAIREGWLMGPEFQCSGYPLVMTGGHGWQIGRECDGETEVMRAARNQIKRGADWIKLMATGGYGTPGVTPNTVQLTRRELAAAVEVAHNANKKTAAHVTGLAGIENAVGAGIDSLEHAEIFATDDPARVDRIIETMRRQGTFVIPTLSCFFRDFIQLFGITGQPTEEYLHARILRQPWFLNNPNHGPMQYYSVWDGVRSLQTYHRNGVKIAAGNDAGLDSVGFEMLPMELKFMRIAGLSPMETLMAATHNAAELMGLSERYSTLEAGKKADFLIVNADPLENPDALYNLHSVYKAGRLHGAFAA